MPQSIHPKTFNLTLQNFQRNCSSFAKCFKLRNQSRTSFNRTSITFPAKSSNKRIPQSPETKPNTNPGFQASDAQCNSTQKLNIVAYSRGSHSERTARHSLRQLLASTTTDSTTLPQKRQSSSSEMFVLVTKNAESKHAREKCCGEDTEPENLAGSRASQPHQKSDRHC